jgi:hypothetical protein
MRCNTFGENLLKCIRCPAAFHARECLGYDNPLGYRGKWLCYVCKVLKFGLAAEAQAQSMPNEPRCMKKLANLSKKAK